MKTSSFDAKKLHEALEKRFGTRKPPVVPQLLDEVAFAVLCRTDGDKAGRKRLGEVKQYFVDWNEVRVSCMRDIENVLAPLSFSSAQAEEASHKLLALLQQIHLDHSSLEVEYLMGAPLKEVRKFISSLEAIEKIDVAQLLLIAFRQAVMPVDDELARIGTRLGFSRKSDLAKLFESSLDADELYCLYFNLLDLARRHCKSGAPSCSKCCIKRFCASYRSRRNQ